MVEYDIPIMKMQEYSLDDIFAKGLLTLIPFYIFSHEKQFMVYNSNEQKLEELKAEYQWSEETRQQGLYANCNSRRVVYLIWQGDKFGLFWKGRKP